MSYSEGDKKLVWEKRGVSETDKTDRDTYGFEMRWDEYGDERTPYAWNIDHVKPKGEHKLCNWQPLHWLTNAVKSDNSGNELTLKDLFDYVTPPITVSQPSSKPDPELFHETLKKVIASEMFKESAPLTFDNLVKYLKSDNGESDLRLLENPQSFEFEVVIQALKRLLDKKTSRIDKLATR